MDKLIITPGKVRGLGNLLTPKQVEDLILYQSEVSIASDGTFIMDYSQSNLIVSNYATILINGATTSVTVRVLNDNQTPIQDVPVTLYDGTTSIANGTTDSQGYAVVSYTLSTDGSHMLHVEANSLKSKRWEVLVSTISSVTLTSSASEVWKGSSVTFSALVKDSSQNIIAGVPVNFIVYDNGTQLKNVTVNTDSNGMASTSYAGQYFSKGNILCAATCGQESDSASVYERYRYYVNGPVHDNDLIVANYVPSGDPIDANGNFIVPKNQAQNSVIYFSTVLPQKFNIEWKYKGSITNFNGFECGLGVPDGADFSWYNSSIVRFTNNTFVVNNESISGSLQSGDVFNFNYNGSSLEISQIRSNNVVWSREVTVSLQNACFGFKSSTYNGYKFNDVIATYYDRDAPEFDGITLTSNKDILSYADGDYATLTAQLMDGQSPAAISGQTVTFTAYKTSDNSVVTTLTADTDSTGLATVSYYGQGTGDLYIQAECTFVSETYAIEDCIDYQAMTDNSKQSRWTIPSTVRTNEFSSNGWKYGNATSFTFIDLNNQSYTTNYSVEATVNAVNGNGAYIIYFENSNAQRQYLLLQPDKFGLTGSESTRTFVSDETYRLEYTADKLKLYINDNLIKTVSHSNGNAKIRLATGTSRYAIIRDFKIKPL